MGFSGEQLTIVKVGGAVVEDEARLSSLLASFVRIEGKKILVHGGGRSATALAAQLGVDAVMVEGRRVTDEAMLRVVTMVYGGLVNKRLVARLQGLGVNAAGLTGADMNVIRSHRRPAGVVDYGFVGDVDCVDAAALLSLLSAGVTPVLAPLTHDGRGTLLNTNADTIAAETAAALARSLTVRLVYTFEKPGVLRDVNDEGSVIRHIMREDFSRLKASGVIDGGMLPKIENSLRSVERGVSRVLITSVDDLLGERGTVIS